MFLTFYPLKITLYGTPTNQKIFRTFLISIVVPPRCRIHVTKLYNQSMGTNSPLIRDSWELPVFMSLNHFSSADLPPQRLPASPELETTPTCPNCAHTSVRCCSCIRPSLQCLIYATNQATVLSLL